MENSEVKIRVSRSVSGVEVHESETLIDFIMVGCVLGYTAWHLRSAGRLACHVIVNQ